MFWAVYHDKKILDEHRKLMPVAEQIADTNHNGLSLDEKLKMYSEMNVPIDAIRNPTNEELRKYIQKNRERDIQ